MVFSLLGIIVPQSLSTLTFLLPSGLFAGISLLLGWLLIHFSIASRFRQPRYKLLFGIGGAVLVVISGVSILYPTLLGLLPMALRPTNILMFLMGGLGLLIAAVEYDRPSLLDELGRLQRKYLLRVALGLKISGQDTQPVAVPSKKVLK